MMRILFPITNYKDIGFRQYTYLKFNCFRLLEILIGTAIFIVIVLILHFSGFFQSKFVVRSYPKTRSERGPLISTNGSNSGTESKASTSMQSSPLPSQGLNSSSLNNHQNHRSQSQNQKTNTTTNKSNITNHNNRAHNIMIAKSPIYDSHGRGYVQNNNRHINISNEQYTNVPNNMPGGHFPTNINMIEKQ